MSREQPPSFSRHVTGPGTDRGEGGAAGRRAPGGSSAWRRSRPARAPDRRVGIDEQRRRAAVERDARVGAHLDAADARCAAKSRAMWWASCRIRSGCTAISRSCSGSGTCAGDTCHSPAASPGSRTMKVDAAVLLARHHPPGEAHALLVPEHVAAVEVRAQRQQRPGPSMNSAGGGHARAHPAAGGRRRRDGGRRHRDERAGRGRADGAQPPTSRRGHDGSKNTSAATTMITGNIPMREQQVGRRRGTPSTADVGERPRPAPEQEERRSWCRTGSPPTPRRTRPPADRGSGPTTGRSVRADSQMLSGCACSSQSAVSLGQPGEDVDHGDLEAQQVGAPGRQRVARGSRGRAAARRARRRGARG